MRVLDSIDSGSQYQFGDKMQRPNFPRSAFDLSHLNTMTVPNAGMLFPVMCAEVLPTDSFTTRLNALLRVLPQVVPPYSRQRMYFDAFYVRCSDVWKNWNTYMKKGKDGNTILTRPALTLDNISTDGLTTTESEGVLTSGIVQANSIYDYMGIPIGTDIVDLIKKGYHIDALPFFALLQIYRWYYLNKNTYIQDDAMFPDDESDFRLDNNGNIISFVNEEVSNNVLGSKMFRLWAQDYFTSALPFAQRGSAPVLPLTVSSGELLGNLTADSIVAKDGTYIQFGSVDNGIGRTMQSTGGNPATQLYPNTGVNGKKVDGLYGMKVTDNTIDYDLPLTLSNVKFSSSSVTFDSSVVLDDIRRLAISQLELERMARTDGTYEEFGLTFYGMSSRNAVDYKPLYVGSCYQDVSFSEVLQTSSSDDTSPLGTYAGHGVSVTQDGNLGQFTADDYGYFIVLCSIMPDVYYFQGLDRKFTKSVQSEEFLPNRDKMGMRPIYNRELFLSGIKSTDDDLFAYQNPFDEFRYMQNEIHGQIADPSKESFWPYTQARKFTETPNFNSTFVTASDARKDYLSAPLEDAYTMQVKFDIRAVRPLSYIAAPAEVMN